VKNIGTILLVSVSLLLLSIQHIEAKKYKSLADFILDDNPHQPSGDEESIAAEFENIYVDKNWVSGFTIPYDYLKNDDGSPLSDAQKKEIIAYLKSTDNHKIKGHHSDTSFRFANNNWEVLINEPGALKNPMWKYVHTFLRSLPCLMDRIQNKGSGPCPSTEEQLKMAATTAPAPTAAKKSMVRVVPLAHDSTDNTWKVLLSAKPGQTVFTDFNAEFQKWPIQEEKEQAIDILKSQTNGIYEFRKAYPFSKATLMLNTFFFVGVPFISAEVLNKGIPGVSKSAKNQYRNQFTWVAVDNLKKGTAQNIDSETINLLKSLINSAVAAIASKQSATKLSLLQSTLEQLTQSLQSLSATL